MLHSKKYYKDMKVAPYWWGGFWDNLHHFTKGSNREGFLTVSANEQDLENGNLDYMLSNEMGRH